MASTRNLTSANAIITLSVVSVYPTPQQLHGFSADDIFSVDAIDTAEEVMGVDGVLSAGMIYVPVPWSITLQADTDSCAMFDTVFAMQQASVQVYRWNGNVVLPGLGKKWQMTNGILKNMQVMPDAKKIVQPRKFQLVWERVTPAASA